MRLRPTELLSVRTLIIAALPFLALPPLLLFPFLSFYTLYTTTIPTLHHAIPLSLKFPTSILEPDTVSSSAVLPASLRSDTPYVLSVKLKVPPTPPNLLLGNFMIRLKGLTGDVEDLSSAARITYRTPWLRTLRTALLSPLYVTGILRETEVVSVELGKVVLPEKFAPEKTIFLEIDGAKSLSTYECELELAAELHGWKAFFKKFRLPIAAVFMSMFVGIEFVAAAWAWWKVANWLEGVGEGYEGDDTEDEDPPLVERQETYRGEIREPLEENPPDRSLLTPSPTPSLREDEGNIADLEGGRVRSSGSAGRGSEGLRNRRRSP